MEPNSNQAQDPSFDQFQAIQLVLELRNKAFMQIIYGLVWWLASATAMYFAMTSTGDSIYWFGGALGSLFHWSRAFKMITATYQVGAKKFFRNEVVLISITAALVTFSASKIVPEYFRIDTPTIGTCWAETDNDWFVPVACWSSDATLKTIDFADSAEACPAFARLYFEPSDVEARYTCLSRLE